MPVIACPACDSQLQADAEPGAVVLCPKCGHQFPMKGGRKAKELKEGERKSDPANGQRTQESAAKTALHTVLLIGGVLLVIGLMFAVAVYAINSRRVEPKTAEQVEKEKERQRIEAELEKVKELKDAEEARERTSAFVALFTSLIILGLTACYVFLIFHLGAHIARDAYARGMNGLGWSAFYFFFQLFFRTTIVYSFRSGSLQTVFLPLGFAAFVLTEPFAWVGWYVYSHSRRPGRLGRCGHCRVQYLTYLPRCPHCDEKTSEQDWF